jgi:hypothetical protein
MMALERAGLSLQCSQGACHAVRCSEDNRALSCVQVGKESLHDFPAIISWLVISQRHPLRKLGGRGSLCIESLSEDGMNMFSHV